MRNQKDLIASFANGAVDDMPPEQLPTVDFCGWWDVTEFQIEWMDDGMGGVERNWKAHYDKVNEIVKNL